MRIVRQYEYGAPVMLRLEEAPAPIPGPGQVVIAMAAVGLNPIDRQLRSGLFKRQPTLPAPVVLGWDLAGTIVAVGPQVEDWQLGHRVAALLPVGGPGAYADQVAVAADLLVALPDDLDFADAACLPLASLTAAQLIEDDLALGSQARVLVTGALGAVGRAAVHVARRGGLEVVAGVRSSQLEQARALGVETLAVDDPRAVEAASFDGIADTVAGDVASRLLARVRPGGAYATVVAAAAAVEMHDHVIRRPMTFVRPDAQRLVPLVRQRAAGDYAIPIARQVPLERIVEAHEWLDAGSTGGKIIVVA